MALMLKAHGLKAPVRRVGGELITTVFVLALLLVYLGGGSSALGLTMLWLAQASLGTQILRFFFRKWGPTNDILVVLGPGYLVGLLTTAWGYMFLQGGIIGKTSIYLVLLLSLASVMVRRERVATGSLQSVRLVVVMVGLTLSAMTWEFPELIVPALLVVSTTLAWQLVKNDWRMRSILLTAASIGMFICGMNRSANWFLESDDLANRAAEGVLTVSRGFLASVGAYPFDEYHWVSPVATALQAELSSADLVFTFTVFSPVSSLIMLFASLGIIVRSLALPKRVDSTLLAVGLLFSLLWRVQINTEATVGRLAISITLLSLFVLVSVGAGREAGERKRVILLVVFAGVLAYMLLLYRPDLVVLMLLLSVGLLAKMKRSSRLSVLFLVIMSLLALVLGIVTMKFVLPLVSQSSVSYATLLIDWRPPDMGWCVRGSTLRDFLCVASLEVNLWAALVAASLLVIRRRHLDVHLFRFWQLTVPLALSFFAFKFTLTSDFYSSIEGFFHLGLVVTLVFVVVVLVAQLAQMSVRDRVRMVSGAAAVFTLHTSSRAGFASLISEYPTTVSDRLQGIMTPALLEWSLASMIVALAVLGMYMAGVRPRMANVLGVLLAACLANGMWILNKERPTTSDVNDALVANVVGPADVSEVGTWLRENTSDDDLLATNYQCRPGEFNRCYAPIEAEADVPWATANWMLMAESRREFLYLSQPFVDDPSYSQLHQLSTFPGTLAVPDFSNLERRGVDYFIAMKDATLPASWAAITKRATFSTTNFAVVRLKSE